MSATVGEVATLAHGYTMAELNRLANVAVRGYRRSASALDADDRYETAWGSIVRHLYAAPEPPTAVELIRVASDALRDAVNDTRHHHGYRTDTDDTAPRFGQYWADLAEETRDDGTAHGGKRAKALTSFADGLVERLALPQVLALLTDAEWNALAATAAHDSLAEAHAALGVSHSTLQVTLRSARRKLVESWLEHETPVRKTYQSPHHCMHGHARADHGYRRPSGKWGCYKCERARQRRVKARGDRAVTLTLEPRHRSRDFDDDAAASRPLTFAPAGGTEPCWCGKAFGHDWPHKADGAAHPRAA